VPFVTFCCTPSLLSQVCTISAYQLGWFNLWNTIDVSVYVLQVG
jgi:hypothetical protein